MSVRGYNLNMGEIGTMLDGLGIEERLLKHSAEAMFHARHVVAFSGPEISAKYGTTPLHTEQMDAFQEWINIDNFQADPERVWRWYNNRKSVLRQSCPSPAHYALAELENILEDFLLITQNTDGLHQRAGSTKLVELHGNIWRIRCTHCNYERMSEKEEPVSEMRCPVCKNWLRPDVVWSGESLPEEEFNAAREACENADLVLSNGTSAAIQPSASMIWQAKATGSLLIEISTKTTTASHLADIRLQTVPEKALPLLIQALRGLFIHQLV
jgi:NAD-dependent deacetylase